MGSLMIKPLRSYPAGRRSASAFKFKLSIRHEIYAKGWVLRSLTQSTIILKRIRLVHNPISMVKLRIFPVSASA